MLLASLPIHPARRHTDWSGWAWDNLDRIPARPEAEFSEVVYGDTYTFVPLQGNQSAVKVGATLCNVCALQPVPGVQVCTTVFTPLEYGVCGLAEEEAVQQYGEEDIEVPPPSLTAH